MFSSFSIVQMFSEYNEQITCIRLQLGIFDSICREMLTIYYLLNKRWRVEMPKAFLKFGWFQENFLKAILMKYEYDNEHKAQVPWNRSIHKISISFFFCMLHIVNKNNMSALTNSLCFAKKQSFVFFNLFTSLALDMKSIIIVGLVVSLLGQTILRRTLNN